MLDLVLVAVSVGLVVFNLLQLAQGRLVWDYEALRKTWNAIIVVAVVLLLINNVALSYVIFKALPLLYRMSQWV